MIPMLTPHEILRDARQKIIDPALWHQGSSYKGEAACSVGWIARICGYAPGPYGVGDITNYGPGQQALDYLRRAVFHGIDSTQPLALMLTGDIPRWNDAEDRTHAEVVAAFDRAVLAAARDEGLFAPYDDRTTEDPDVLRAHHRSLVTA
jgi:hypothetical protein